MKKIEIVLLVVGIGLIEASIFLFSFYYFVIAEAECQSHPMEFAIKKYSRTYSIPFIAYLQPIVDGRYESQLPILFNPENYSLPDTTINNRTALSDWNVTTP